MEVFQLAAVLVCQLAGAPKMHTRGIVPELDYVVVYIEKVEKGAMGKSVEAEECTVQLYYAQSGDLL